jgi:hypothetical protein
MSQVFRVKLSMHLCFWFPVFIFFLGPLSLQRFWPLGIWAPRLLLVQEMGDETLRVVLMPRRLFFQKVGTNIREAVQYGLLTSLEPVLLNAWLLVGPEDGRHQRWFCVRGPDLIVSKGIGGALVYAKSPFLMF